MKIIERRLKNNIPVLLENIESINTVALGIFVKTGARNEREDESGVSHYIEHMLFKGTTTRSAKDISEEIDNEGGIINAYTSRDVTCYYIQMLSNKIEKGIEILSDMLLNSTFLPEELEKERNVIIEEIKMYEDIPEEVIHEENLTFALTGAQANSISGTAESLKKIDREKFLDYFKAQYKPENIVISIAGKIDIENIMELLEKEIGKLENNSISREIKTEFTINSGEKIIKKDTQQVHLCFNTRGVALLDKKNYPSMIILNVLAGNMSSRLFQKIREERGLAYSVYGYMTNFLEGGVFTIYTGTTKENYKEVLEMIKNECNDIYENGITSYELQKSKNQFLSILTLGLESSKGKMSRMANHYLLYNKVLDVEETIKKIENITLQDISETAKYMFEKEYYSWTILGDVE